MLVHLFLGFPISSAYQQILSQLDHSERQLIIQPGVTDYLQEIERDGVHYLGKNLGPEVEMTNLEMAQFHVISLLKRLDSDYPYQAEELVLLAIEV